MELRFVSGTLKELERLDRHTRELIVGKLAWFAQLPDPLSHARPITGRRGLYRFRIGHYRAFFVLHEGAMVIVRIRKRGEGTYRDLK